MAGYEIEDAQGNRYRISKGAGPDYPHPENIGAGSSLIASGLLQGMPFESLVAANDYFWFDTLCKIPDCPGNPADALANAIASSHLTIEKVGTALAVDDEEPDPRAGLRVKIQQALTQIIAGERAEAAMYQRQMDQENILTKGLIYTGSFMEGIGSSAWGAVVWAKEVSDLINPVVIISNHAKAVQAGWESEDFYATYSSNVAMAQKRELVEALGFDPTSITEQQIDEAIAMANLVLDDPSLRDMLYRFVKDYVEAQHAVEITNVAGSGAFEIILTIVLAAVTGGAGVIAAVGSKTALIRKFQKVGDLLSEFAKATRRLKLKARERKAKSRPADFKDLETAEAPVKKTDARGAEESSNTKTVIKHKTGNHQVVKHGQRWNLPAGRTIHDIPDTDPIGDNLQRLTDEAAARWDDSQLSLNEQLAIEEAKESGEYWRSNLLKAQAKGRWIENEVRASSQTTEILEEIEWSRRGVDVTDTKTGLKYDILSGTSSNMNTHAKRMPDEMFRMITF